MNFILFFFTFITPTHSYAGAHDVHISMCELKYNNEASSFEVSIRIFIDDLELALTRNGTQVLQLGTPAEALQSDQLIAEYLNKHFGITADGVILKPEFIGKEVTEDLQAVWCHIQFRHKAASVSACTFHNSILLEVYDDQRNIMDIRMAGNQKDYAILEAGNTTLNYHF